jgi:hypothetical protein
MRGVRTRAIALLVSIVLYACVTPPAPTVVSTILQRADEKPRKVLVVAKLGQDLPDEFEDGYIAAFAHGIEKLGVAVSTMKLTGLELDRAAPEKAIEAFMADAVFTIVFNERSVSGSTHRGAVTVRLLDARSTELWRSRQSFAFTYFAVAGQAVTDAGARGGDAAAEKFVADRIFPGTI